MTPYYQALIVEVSDGENILAVRWTQTFYRDEEAAILKYGHRFLQLASEPGVELNTDAWGRMLSVSRGEA